MSPVKRGFESLIPIRNVSPVPAVVIFLIVKLYSTSSNTQYAHNYIIHYAQNQCLACYFKNVISYSY